MATQRFDVTGMTCAACSARVEKAAGEVAGVDKAVVNLLKNSMDVTYDGSPETLSAISEAVDKAGYGAMPRVEASAAVVGATAPMVKPENTAAKEAKTVRMRLIVSFIFAIPLFYLDMGHMWGWPLPACFLGPENSMTLGLTQLLLTLPIVFVNFKFFRNGFKGLAHRAPNMDTLVALGATASMVYSIAQLYHVGIALGAGELHEAHMAAMDLYFEGAGMILTLITLGKYFEARSKGRTTDAITALMDLAPKTAMLIADDEYRDAMHDGLGTRRPECARRWRRARRERGHRRIGAHGGERAGGQGCGRRSHRCDSQHCWLLQDARRARGQRYCARAYHSTR